MKTLVRFCLAAGLALTSVGLLTVWAPASSASGLLSVTDPVGDTVVDGNGTAIAAPRADVLTAAAEVRPEGIAFSLRVRELVDPATDANWRRPDTYISWKLDTDANDVFDYEIRYHAVPGHPAGEVSRLGVQARQVCAVSSAGFSPDAGYSLVVDPNCLGNPANFSYRSELYYGTNVNVAVDIAPDRRPVLVAMSAPPVTPPSSAPTVTTPAPAPAAAPTQAAPAPASAPRTSPKAPAPAVAPAKPAPARVPAAPRASSPAPAAAPAPVVAQPAPVAAPVDLAKTGPRAAQLARFGAAFLLAGLSLMIATGRLPVPARR